MSLLLLLPRLLLLTHSAGFVHSVVPQTVEDGLSLAGRGRFVVDATQDCAGITAENLSRYQAVAFYTTGELPLSAEQREALLEYVRGGGGFVGIHAAADTFYEWPAYGEMLGGVFDGHPWHEEVTVRVEDRAHPSTVNLGDSFEIVDEIYQFRSWDRDRVHVLLSLDPKSVDLSKPEVKRADRDFALAWCKPFGEGRVFYTALGHRESVWSDPRFLGHVSGGVLWAMGAQEEKKEEGFVQLFNGKDFTGWKFHFDEKGADPTKTFSVRDGAIVCTGKPAGYMYTEKSYREFTLHFDWRYARPADLEDDSKFPGNSGYLLFIQKHEVWPRSIEVQGMNRDVAGIIPIKTEAKFETDAQTRERERKPVGEWNTMWINVKGGRITVYLNGELVSTVTEYEPKEGPIGFQSEGAEIHWRNIRIREE
jgi:type 1 glutamine amidotransferase